MKPIYTPFVSADPTRLPLPCPRKRLLCYPATTTNSVLGVKGAQDPCPRRFRSPPVFAVSFLGEGQIQMSPAPSFAAREPVRIVLCLLSLSPPAHTRMLQMIRKRPSTALCRFLQCRSSVRVKYKCPPHHHLRHESLFELFCVFSPSPPLPTPGCFR